MADWRNFKASLKECLEESNPPQDDLRDHVVQQLPQSVREFVLKEEMAASRNKYLVKVRPPRHVTRETVCRMVGNELGLIIRDMHPESDLNVVNCLAEDIQHKALALDGVQIADGLGRT